MNLSDIRSPIGRTGTVGRVLVFAGPVFITALLLFGLLIDLGQILLARGYLRHAADAAAAAAAFEFRRDPSLPALTAAAREAAAREGVVGASIRVDTCATDASLCGSKDEPARQPVRVTIEEEYPLTILSRVNFTIVPVKETGVSYAAAMDVVLLIDVSESMAWEIDPNEDLDYWEDPSNPTVCNPTNDCLPFKNVKAAASAFAGMVLDRPSEEEWDRLSVITFANGWEAGSKGILGIWGSNWTNDINVALDPDIGIPSLTVYDPGPNNICPFDVFACDGALKTACPATPEDIPTGPCTYAYYSDAAAGGTGKYAYGRLNCARFWDITTADGANWTGIPEAISACTTTNTGGALRRAAEQFSFNERPESLRAVVLLTDGPANATFGTVGDLDGSGDNDLITVINPTGLDPTQFVPYLPLGFCPDGTWIGRGTGHNNRSYCQDGDVDTYHSLPADPAHYDADDFARDQALIVACNGPDSSPSCAGIPEWAGASARIFTIGLGSAITDFLDDDPVVENRKPYGGSLLRYIAALGDDGDAATDPCAGVADYRESCGNYYFAQEAADLEGIFGQIHARLESMLAPAPFGKLAPADGAYASTNPALTWNAAPNAARFEFCYDTTDDDSCDGVWSDAGLSTGAGLTGLTEGATYYWQARAVNIVGSTDADAGSWWSFTARRQSFADVPVDHPLWRYIEAFHGAGITTGCGVSPLIFCPEQNVTRAAMAVFLLRAKYGSAYAPPAAGHLFADLPVAGKEWQEAWVDELYREGITGGCGVSPLRFCPEAPLSRAAMAVVVLRAKYGAAYTPPAASHFFADMPVAGREWMEPWVDQAYREGITTGCGTGPLIFCPDAAVKRQAMAAFIVRAFNLPLP